MKKDLRIYQPGEWADGDIITAIDASQTETPRRPQLNVGILLWPEFPLLALAGLTDALRHAADMGDDSQKIRCSASDERYTRPTSSKQFRNGDDAG